jgi:hypothetical protein
MPKVFKAVILLAPGFSPVLLWRDNNSRFNGLSPFAGC